jgi:hypothetical protein
MSSPIITDIFLAYGLSPSGLSEEEIAQMINNISQTKKTFGVLQEVVNSNRHPYTVMTISAKVGMFIPPRKRIGLEAYNFFLQNIKYYENTFERSGQQVPNLYDIYMAKDRINLLMKFRDDEILRPGFRFSRNYANRKDMITSFIENNILIHGQFTLESNSRKAYSTKAKVITFIEFVNGQTRKFFYSTDELIMLIDMPRRTVWRDPQGFTNPQNHLAFSRLSLHHLRQQILEKFEQWRQRDGLGQFVPPVQLSNILMTLETILAGDVRNDVNAYLGNPIL